MKTMLMHIPTGMRMSLASSMQMSTIRTQNPVPWTHSIWIFFGLGGLRKTLLTTQGLMSVAYLGFALSQVKISQRLDFFRLM
jgi:hypothetical protein